MKKGKIWLIIALVSLVGIGIMGFLWNRTKPKEKSLANKTDSIDIHINTDDDDEKIDWNTYPTYEVTLTDSIKITDEGVYHLTGTISDGYITVDTSSNVKLILDNVSITNLKGPAIYVANASDTVIELKEGSTNYLEDGSSYSGFEEDEIGTIYSHDDLTFMGTGTLKVKSNWEDAIVSKDDLKFISGTYEIDSEDDGIRGKDSVYIQDGNFTITSLGDGMKSTNDTDSEKGYIYIENGTFQIQSSLDGISSETKMLIENGTFQITTGEGSDVESTQENWGFRGNSISSGNTDSMKGLKANDNLVIREGNFSFNTEDDAIHCNNYIGIQNGNFKISSGDDGIHADKELIIDNGTIDITKSYEGIEAAKITINGGTISLFSRDDGVNVAGGNDSSALGRPGANNFHTDIDNGQVLTITGGDIYVNASGDGIDVNGSAYIYGGNIQVDGPTNSGNGALDYDGVFDIYGGTILAGGSFGMNQGASDSSTQYHISIGFNQSYGEGDIIAILDSSGKEIVKYQSSKNYNSLVISHPDFAKNKTYTLQINGENDTTFTISSISTNIGTQAAGGFGDRGMQRPMDNGRGPRR